MRVFLLFLTGCVFGGDVGVLGRSPSEPRGASVTGHWHSGGGGGGGKFLASLGIDTRLDVSTDATRWSGGISTLGGVNVGPLYIDGRVGVWHAIVSTTSESLTPSFELGGYVPTSEHFEPKHPEHGFYNSGVVFGIRDDYDVVNYVTVFVGYALFISPGY